MKLISKIVLLLILGIACGFGQCIVDQLVNNLPIADVNGAYWTIYDLADPEGRVVVESDPSCMTFPSSGALFWAAELAYWSPVPAVGDSLLMIGSWDSAYVNPGVYGDKQTHTGFYWLYSDIVDDVALTHWEEDTVRPMPKPIVTKTGPGAGANDTIWVTIPNPRETRYSGQTAYDVLGYWLFADTTDAAGTPNAYNAGTAMDFGFIPVDGVFGENTVHWMLESDGFEAWNTWTVYFAYKLVARPDTTGGVDNPDAPGHASYYFSQNSDAITVYQNVIGIEENTQPRIQQINLQALPNIFCENTRIVFSITKSALVKLVVYNTSGQIIRTLVNDVKPAGNHHIEFDGTDTQGIELPAGIYFYQLQTSEQQLTGRLTKLR
ncbi:MAG: FlgD immunoglobulin-like domain containing protein [bacterium]